MSNIQISITKKKDVNDYIRIALSIIPCVSFLFSVISIFACCSKDSNGIFYLTYLSIISFHGLRIYLCATNKSFFGKKLSNDTLLKRIWLSKHTHFAILVTALLFFKVFPTLFFFSYMLYILREVAKTMKEELGPRLGDLKESVDSFAKTVNESKLLKQIRASVEVALLPYLFFAALFTFKGKYFIAFIVYLVNNILFGLMADNTHKWVYHTIHQYLIEFTKSNNDIRKIVDQVVEVLQKVNPIAHQIYPIPQNAKDVIDMVKAKIQ